MAEKFMLIDDAERQLLIERYSDLNFVDNTDGFKCVRCNRIPITHYFTNCGHLLCLNCKRIIDNGGFKCQLCNSLITNANEQRIEFEIQLQALRSKCPNTKYGCQHSTNLAQIPEHIKSCEFTQEAALPALLKNKDPTYVMMENLKSLREEMEVMKAEAAQKLVSKEMLENLKLLREEIKAMRAEVKQLHLKNNENQFPDATNLHNFDRNETNTGSTKDKTDLEKSHLGKMQQVEVERKNEGSSTQNSVSKEILEEMSRAHHQKISLEIQEYFYSQMEMQNKIYAEFQKIAMKVSNLEPNTVHNEAHRSQNAQPKMNTKFENPMLKQKTLGNAHVPAAKKKVNLLLIGPVNVGKSTFVNAFINYLKFKDLEEAQRSELHCLIPCAFTIYEGDSNEHYIKFGEEDANENTRAQGQSATQNCKSYKIEVDDLTLNIIDSPGFGDTRGEDQDTANVKHIIDYVAPYDNLVIGVLLKPNEARLSAAFENCMRQLIIHFYSNANREIVFIFTNSRSFSYRPGDTITPLKEMLIKLQQSPLATPLEVKFNRENVFCLDNEAFRYLVALRSGVRFNNNDYDDFKKSWQTSAKECNRLIRCLQGETSASLEVGQSQLQSFINRIFNNRASSNT